HQYRFERMIVVGVPGNFNAADAAWFVPMKLNCGQRVISGGDPGVCSHGWTRDAIHQLLGAERMEFRFDANGQIFAAGPAAGQPEFKGFDTASGGSVLSS